jgi:hypothetical protein
MALKVHEVLEFTAAPATVVIPVGVHDLGGHDLGGHDMGAVESRESVTVTDAVESRESVVRGRGAGAGARAVAGSGVGLGVVAKGAEKASIDNVPIYKPSIDMAPMHKPCMVPDHPYKASMVPDPDSAALARVDSGQCFSITAVSMSMCQVSHAFRVTWPQP